MDINFTLTYKAYFDLDQAEEDFHKMLYWNPEEDINKILYDATEQNIIWPTTIDDLPNEVVETAATALRKRIGGIQTEMNLDTYIDFSCAPWQKDSVWKK